MWVVSTGKWIYVYALLLPCFVYHWGTLCHVNRLYFFIISTCWFEFRRKWIKEIYIFFLLKLIKFLWQIIIFVFAGKSSQWPILWCFFLKRKAERLLPISVFLPILDNESIQNINTFINIKMYCWEVSWRTYKEKILYNWVI